jgi:hypothetical protein
VEALTKSLDFSKGNAESFNTFFLAMSHWQLGEKVKARQWYDRAVQWMEENKSSLAQLHQEELRRIPAEAVVLLGLKASPGPGPE